MLDRTHPKLDLVVLIITNACGRLRILVRGLVLTSHEEVVERVSNILRLVMVLPLLLMLLMLIEL